MSDYTTWHVGMKVVCVKEGGWTTFTGPDNSGPAPKYGEICVVSKIDPFDGEVFIGVEGYLPTDLFWARHFRKVQPRKTSIASLEAILHGARVPEDA